MPLSNCMVTVPPSWMIEPRDQELTQGTKGYVHCLAVGSPPPRITWSIKSGLLLSSSFHYSNCYEMIGHGSNYQPVTAINGIDSLPNGTLSIDTRVIDTNASLIEARCAAESSPDQVIVKEIRIKVIGKLLNCSFNERTAVQF